MVKSWFKGKINKKQRIELGKSRLTHVGKPTLYI